jgi:AraC family transcriptional regulator
MGGYAAITLGTAAARSAQLDGISISLLEFAPGTSIAPHEHERACLAVTLDGSFETALRRRSYACARGSVHIEPSAERHHNRFDAAGARVLVLNVDEVWLDRLGEARGAVDAVRHYRDRRIVELAMRAAHELAAPECATKVALQGLSLEMLAWAARPHGNVPGLERSRWIGRVEELLRARFSDPPSLPELAREAGVHPVHLARSFRAGTGLSVGAFVRKLRLEWATERLVRSDQPLAFIAAEAGFADQSHFTRLFRTATGVTPARYRRLRGEGH